MKITITVERENSDRQSVTQSTSVNDGNFEWFNITRYGGRLLDQVARKFDEADRVPAGYEEPKTESAGEAKTDKEAREEPAAPPSSPFTYLGDLAKELDRLQAWRNRGTGPR